MIRITTYKETTDDWYPVYCEIPTNPAKFLVKVSLVSLFDGKTRVCVWGGDDFGLELDFNSEHQAKKIFHKIIELPLVNQQILRDFGFINA